MESHISALYLWENLLTTYWLKDFLVAVSINYYMLKQLKWINDYANISPACAKEEKNIKQFVPSNCGFFLHFPFLLLFSFTHFLLSLHASFVPCVYLLIFLSLCLWCPHTKHYDFSTQLHTAYPVFTKCLLSAEDRMECHCTIVH